MHYFSRITHVKEEDGKTSLIMTVDEEIKDKLLKQRRYNTIDAEIRIDDRRFISADQRKKIYASIRDISDFTGNPPEQLKEYLKFDYMSRTGEDYFSLSDCSMNRAKDFISHIIEFALIHNFPLSDLAINRTDDIDRYLYNCIKYRRCAISGSENADIHHVTGSRLGMGRNRKKISHTGLELIALNRKWHSRVHAEGEDEIFDKYKIYGIKVGDEVLSKLKIRHDEIS